MSPLQGSVNIHRYSPTLRWIIVNYNLPWSAIPSFSFNVMETVRDRKMRGDHWKSWTSSIEWNWISVWKYCRQRLENLIFHSFVQFHSMEMFSVVRKYSRNTLEIFLKKIFQMWKRFRFFSQWTQLRSRGRHFPALTFCRAPLPSLPPRFRGREGTDSQLCNSNCVQRIQVLVLSFVHFCSGPVWF